MPSSDTIRGHLDSIVLRLISEKDRYGYEISKEIALRTDKVFEIKETSLYAVLQRLERKGYINSYSGQITHGGKRRYYSITESGGFFLQNEIEDWEKTKKIIDILMEGLNNEYS